MASHGVSRPATKEQRTAEARKKELQEIDEYRSLVDFVNQQISEDNLSPDLLEKTGSLLRKNPEYYTVWNIRRQIWNREFDSIKQKVRDGVLTQDNNNSQTLDIIQFDLGFLFPILLKFPKCYWIWNHRLWLLSQASLLLPVDIARPLWEEELTLVGKMLTRDSRNFHGWGYRRTVVENLEQPSLNGHSMAQTEYEYTTRMIGNNLSNFSAWHNRSKLILRILNEQNATTLERKNMLDGEIKLIHNALFDPYDQSLWFYHQNLMCTFDPITSSRSMAPELSKNEKLDYLAAEHEFVNELLEDAADCKWIYLALIECTFIEWRIKEDISNEEKSRVQAWLQTLQKLDPDRSGRWSDMEAVLQKA